GFRIDLNVAGHGVAERLRFGHSVLGEDVDGDAEHLPAIVRGCNVDLARREVVIGNIDLILIGGDFAWVHGQPRSVNKRRVESSETIERPSRATVVAIGESTLEAGNGGNGR